MAAGCVGSYIGKGSCEAGAVTAAFDYIYNANGGQAKLGNGKEYDLPTVPQSLVDGAAGFGAGLSFGLTNAINERLGTLLITGGEIGTKNQEARTVPLFAPLARLVQTMRERKRLATDDAFIVEIENARLQILRACERLGLRRFGHHTMRHFFCSNAIEAGCDFKVIAGWVGHKDGGVLVAMTYGHLRHEHSAAMAKRLTFDAAADESSFSRFAALSE